MGGPVSGGGEPDNTWDAPSWDAGWQQPGPQHYSQGQGQGQGQGHAEVGVGWAALVGQEGFQHEPKKGKGGWIAAGLLGVVALVALGALVFVMLSGGQEESPSASGATQWVAPGDSGATAAAAGEGQSHSAPTTTVTRVREAATRQEPAAGTYSGTGDQVGLRSGYRDYELPISMTFGGTPTVEYHSLNCTARLESNGFRDGAAQYTERVTRGGCDQDGTWSIRIQSETKIHVEYHPPSGGYEVTGTFTR